MSWKETANGALYRVTGHLLTSETPAQRREAIRAAGRRGAARARRRVADRRRQLAALEARRRAEGRAEREQRADEGAEQRKESAQERERRRLLASHDEELAALIDRVAPRTMTSPAKLAALIEATRHVVAHGIEGDVVECGVWRGGSMQAIAWTLGACGDTDRELHLFDTYEGMPPPTEEDRRLTTSGMVTAQDLLVEADTESRLWAVAGLEDVEEGMLETGYPPERVHFHQGLVEETIPAQAPARISLLRLDTDWYASTRHELEQLYDRLSPGGVLVLDDYGDWDGARRATDEWLAATGAQIFLAPMGSGRIGIKPAR